jgi:hypothetical protein
MTLIPAYGRDYTSAAQARADWDANKDFIIADPFHGADGKPTNKADCKSMGDHGPHMVRYANNRKQAALTA